MIKVILDEDYALATYDSERKMAKIIWKGNPSQEKYRLPFKVLLEHSRSGEKIVRMYTDTTKQGIVSPENRTWFSKEMFPAAVEEGLQKVAVVTDANAFRRYYLNMLIKAINKFNIPFRLFGDEATAEEFLMEE